MASRWSERTRFAGGLAVLTVGPLIAAPLLAPSGGHRTPEVLGAFVVVAYAGHVAVTARLWTVADVRQLTRNRPVRLIAIPVGLVLVGAGVAFVASGRIFDWLLLGFFAWQFTHFQRQNLGLVAAMSARWDAGPVLVSERRVVTVSGWCATVTLLARPTLLGVSRGAVSAPAVGPVLRLTATGWAVCIVVAMVNSLRSKRPAPVAAALVLSVWFVAPVFLFGTPAAAVTGMVVAHGLQYLWVVGCRSHAACRPNRDRLAGWRIAGAMGAIAIVGGSALSAMSELHAAGGAERRLLYGAYFGIVMAHFAIDGVVWRRAPVSSRTSAVPLPLLPSPTLGGL